MRLRSLATAAILGAALLPPSLAGAVPPANVTVERARLRALILQRHTLVQQLAAADGARGQILTLNALVAADAILSADAAALEHTIRRLIPRPSTRHVTRHKVRRRVKRAAARAPAATVAAPALLAAPGVLWSPSARAMTVGLAATLATPDPAPIQRGPARIAAPHPLTGLGNTLTSSTTPLLDTATLSLRPAIVGARLPQAAPPSVTTTHARATQRVAPTRPAARHRAVVHMVAVPLAPSNAPSHGRLALAGASGPVAIAADNARVAGGGGGGGGPRGRGAGRPPRRRPTSVTSIGGARPRATSSPIPPRNCPPCCGAGASSHGRWGGYAPWSNGRARTRPRPSLPRTMLSRRRRF